MQREPETEFASEEKRARDLGKVLDSIWAMPLRGRSGAVPAEPLRVSSLRAPAAIAKGANE